MKSPFLLVKSPLFSTFSPGSFSPRQAACSAFATLEETAGVESVGWSQRDVSGYQYIDNMYIINNT